MTDLQMFATEIILTLLGALSVVVFAFWRWSQRDALRGKDILDIKTLTEKNSDTLEEIKKDVTHKDKEIAAIRTLAENATTNLEKHEEGCDAREKRTIERFERGAKAIHTLTSEVDHLKSDVAEVKADIKSIIKRGCHLDGDK